MKDFKNSESQAIRRLVREQIRKSKLTSAQKDIATAYANEWFRHGSKGYMHPGLEKIAKRTKFSIRTVTRTAALMRESGVLVVLKYPNGGAFATRYRFDVIALFKMLGWKPPAEVEGYLFEMDRRAGNLVPETADTEADYVIDYEAASGLPKYEDTSYAEGDCFSCPVGQNVQRINKGTQWEAKPSECRKDAPLRAAGNPISERAG